MSATEYRQKAFYNKSTAVKLCQGTIPLPKAERNGKKRPAQLKSHIGQTYQKDKNLLIKEYFESKTDLYRRNRGEKATNIFGWRSQSFPKKLWLSSKELLGPGAAPRAPIEQIFDWI
jgi:hypothetical protein